jgi:hypothetical protein
VLDQLAADDVLLVTRLDRLARSPRDLLNILGAIAARAARFRSLHDTWADTTTAHGRLILTVPGGQALKRCCLAFTGGPSSMPDDGLATSFMRASGKGRARYRLRPR